MDQLLAQQDISDEARPIIKAIGQTASTCYAQVLKIAQQPNVPDDLADAVDLWTKRGVKASSDLLLALTGN